MRDLGEKIRIEKQSIEKVLESKILGEDQTILKTDKHTLKVQLTSEELREYGADLAEKVAQVQDLEDQKKAVVSDFKSQIDAASAECSTLARRVQNGYEFRQVEVNIILDQALRMITVVRTDTGEIVKRRPATADELQVTMFRATPEEEESGSFNTSDPEGRDFYVEEDEVE